MPYKLNPFTGELDLTESNYYFYGKGTTQHFQGDGKVYATYQMIGDVWNGIPLEVKADVIVTNLKWFIDTPAVGNSVFGLYEIGSNGEPTNLLWQTPAFNNNIAGLQTYTFPAPIKIKAGFYALAHHTSSNPIVKCTSWNQTISNMGIVPTLTFTENFYYTWIGSIPYSTYAGTLPSTWPVAAPKFLANNTRNALVGFTIQP